MYITNLAQIDSSTFLSGSWLFVATLLGGIGIIAIMLILGRKQVTIGSVLLGFLPVAAALGINFYSQPITFELSLLHLLTWLSVIVGVGFVTFRQPVYAALSFAAIVLLSCVVFVLNNAPFLAAATMIVYAGATIIVFLFVLMFAQRSKLQPYDVHLNMPWMAVIAGCVIFGLLSFAVSTMPIAPAAAIQDSTVADFGKLMFSDYLWTVELAGALLLIATIAAILIAQDQSVLPHITSAFQSTSNRDTASDSSARGDQ